MENKLFDRSKSLLKYLSSNKIIDDSTYEESLKTLHIIKSTSDNDKDYITIYKNLLWFLLENNTETIFNDDIFSDKMKDVRFKHAYIYFYDEYLYDTDTEVIKKKKELAKQQKQDIKDKYFDRHKQYPDKEIILKLSDPVLKNYMEF